MGIRLTIVSQDACDKHEIYRVDGIVSEAPEKLGAPIATIPGTQTTYLDRTASELHYTYIVRSFLASEISCTILQVTNTECPIQPVQLKRRGSYNQECGIFGYPAVADMPTYADIYAAMKKVNPKTTLKAPTTEPTKWAKVLTHEGVVFIPNAGMYPSVALTDIIGVGAWLGNGKSCVDSNVLGSDYSKYFSDPTPQNLTVQSGTSVFKVRAMRIDKANDLSKTVCSFDCTITYPSPDTDLIAGTECEVFTSLFKRAVVLRRTGDPKTLLGLDDIDPKEFYIQPESHMMTTSFCNLTDKKWNAGGVFYGLLSLLPLSVGNGMQVGYKSVVFNLDRLAPNPYSIECNASYVPVLEYIGEI